MPGAINTQRHARGEGIEGYDRGYLDGKQCS